MGDAAREVTRLPGGLQTEPFWTVSNLVSVLRVLLVVPTLWLLFWGYTWGTIGLILAMVGTDMADGYLARRRGEITRWGKILDPLADKLAIDSISVALVILKGMPAWVAGAIVGRDVVIVVAGVFLMARERVVVSSNIWGKLTSIVISVLALVYVLDLEAFKAPIDVLTACMLVVSSVSYGFGFFRKRAG